MTVIQQIVDRMLRGEITPTESINEFAGPIDSSGLPLGPISYEIELRSLLPGVGPRGAPRGSKKPLITHATMRKAVMASLSRLGPRERQTGFISNVEEPPKEPARREVVVDLSDIEAQKKLIMKRLLSKEVRDLERELEEK